MRRISIALLLLAAPLFASQPGDDAFLTGLESVKRFEEVAISPDGKRVAWTLAGEGTYVDDKRVSPAKHEDAGLAWSPDSKQLAWISDSNLVIDGRPVTTLKGWMAEPKWSPDGTSIAFLFIDNAKRASGPLVAMSRDVGVIGEETQEQRLAVFELPTKKVRLVTPADMYVYHFDWAPDGKRLAAIAAPGNGDQNWWIAQLYVADGDAIEPKMTSIYKPKLQIADPKWSADGKHIAVIEGLMSDEGSTGGDVMIVDADGKAGAENATPQKPVSATELLDVGGSTIDFLAVENGTQEIRHIRTVGEGRLGHIDDQVRWHGTDHIGSLAIAADGKTSAVIRSSGTQPAEVWVGPIGAWTQRTHVNDGYKPSWGPAKSIEWTNDTFHAQGWLLYPPDYSPAKKYPMVVQVHGGPASVALNRWPSDFAALLARRGFFVFMPNPRGSFGGGEAFTEANVKDFGYGDLRDILAGVDAVGKEVSIDPQRVGLWGWSYGGFMTMFGVTQTQRFRAAVAGAGLANWQSYYGENDITQWMIPYFGASVYDDPAVYAKSSAMTFIKNVKTPTLIVVGERDGECPAPQSFEFWRALKTLGVETQLVVYPDEGHRFVKPEHKHDVARRVADWFETHMK
jgi:dipeptidyl aminopeptidase/acylaminoacyl peptidase